ncbi:MAG TPA: OmpA family protein [Rheinheimera sp.]|nr:OmpA family protein [Rheinheimera sp.]
MTFLHTGCASTAGNKAEAITAAVARPQSVFLARLQQRTAAQTSELADGSIKVAFPGITAFSHDGAGINDEQQSLLSSVVESLDQISYQRLTVVGHTDSSGQLMYNNKLSQQRAEQVKAFLLQQGLTAEQVAAEGRGPSEPVADNKTVQGRAANRRIELVLAF